MNVLQRIMAPTPQFFRILRNAGLALTAASAVVLTSPVVMPDQLMQVAGYLAMGGSVLSTVSQMTVENNEPPTLLTPALMRVMEPAGMPSLPALPAILANGKGKGRRVNTKNDAA